jgi:ABC-type phosphate transport system substrate-binding protein
MALLTEGGFYLLRIPKKGVLHAVAGLAALGTVLLSGASAAAVIMYPVPVLWDGSTTLFPFVSEAAGPTQAPATYPYAQFLSRNQVQFGSKTGRCDLLWGNIDVADSSANITSTGTNNDNQFNGTANDYGVVTGPLGNPPAPQASASACDSASVTYGTAAQVTPFTTSQEQDWIVAHDGVIPVVNTSTLAIVTDISRQSLANIYSCDPAHVTAPAVSWNNWTRVNATYPNQTIKPIARDLSGGTRQSFLDLLKNFGLTDANEQACITLAGTTRATGNPNVQTEVASTPNSIGYVGHGFDTFPGISNTTVEGIAPTDANILTNTYPMSRLLHQITLQYAVSPSVALGTYSGAIDFVNYINSAAGQADVVQQGFVQMQTPTVIPDWDVNVDQVTNVNDIVLVGQTWLQSNSNHHWIRQDVNRAGVVNVVTIATIGAHWLQTWTPSIQ